jgi:hypothetical protein
MIVFALLLAAIVLGAKGPIERMAKTLQDKFL